MHIYSLNILDLLLDTGKTKAVDLYKAYLEINATTRNECMSSETFYNLLVRLYEQDYVSIDETRKDELWVYFINVNGLDALRESRRVS